MEIVDGKGKAPAAGGIGGLTEKRLIAHAQTVNTKRALSPTREPNPETVDLDQKRMIAQALDRIEFMVLRLLGEAPEIAPRPEGKGEGDGDAGA